MTVRNVEKVTKKAELIHSARAALSRTLFFSSSP